MPDITMCTGEGCPLKDECYRYKARPSDYRQVYFERPPNRGNKCEYFSKIWQKPNKNAKG